MKKNLPTKNYNLQTKKGFTLVETLVSLFIFSLSITAIIVVSGKGVSDTTIAKNKITAVALAQEGIEMVRNIRDTYALSEATPGAGWTEFVSLVTPGGPTGQNCKAKGCEVGDVQDFFWSGFGDLTFEDCDVGAGMSGFPSDCPFLNRERLSSDTTSTAVGTVGFYGNGTSSDDTPFQRTIFIECVNQARCVELRVESVVAWKQGTEVTQVNAVEYLFNWFKTVPVTP